MSKLRRFADSDEVLAEWERLQDPLPTQGQGPWGAGSWETVVLAPHECEC